MPFSRRDFFDDGGFPLRTAHARETGPPKPVRAARSHANAPLVSSTGRFFLPAHTAATGGPLSAVEALRNGAAEAPTDSYVELRDRAE
jgi:hypothetical protein